MASRVRIWLGLGKEMVKVFQVLLRVKVRIGRSR